MLNTVNPPDPSRRLPATIAWKTAKRRTLVGAALFACLALYLQFGTDLRGVEPMPQGQSGIPACKTDLARHLRLLDAPGLAAAIVKDGRIVCTAVAGMANIQERRPVTPDTLFLIASVSKTVTATALMQLYEQGKFRLDDDINRYLPFRVSIPASPRSSITFRHLLTHASSIDDNREFVNVVTKGRDSPVSLADFTRGYLTPGGAYYSATDNFNDRPPGTRVEYSNMGIVLAGYLVEVISGVPFDRYSKEHIFEPLGMPATSWRLADMDLSRLAMPYRGERPRFTAFGHYGEPNYPDGMLRSSLMELSRFLAAYMQEGVLDGRRILKPATVRDMLRSRTDLDSSQGLVWFNRSIDGRTVWGHNGSDVGASAQMWFDPDDDIGVILFANGQARLSALMEELFDEAGEY